MSEKWINFKTLNLEHTFRETLCALEALLLMSTHDLIISQFGGLLIISIECRVYQSHAQSLETIGGSLKFLITHDSKKTIQKYYSM